ncbi:hypothetical protein D3C72_2510290 [compost metagenome]
MANVIQNALRGGADSFVLVPRTLFQQMQIAGIKAYGVQHGERFIVQGVDITQNAPGHAIPRFVA